MSTYTDLPYINRRLSTCGVFYWTDEEKGIECYADSDLSGVWDKENSDHA